MAARKAANAGKGITSSSRDPLAKLPVHKRRYVAARASGANVKEAAEHAQVSKRMGSKYEAQADIQAAYRSLIQKAIPAKKLVNLIKGGCEAKMPVFGPDGRKVSERADWKTRRPFIEMAAKHGQYHEDKTVGAGGGVVISMTVNHIGQPEQGAQINGRSQHLIEAAAETVRAT